MYISTPENIKKGILKIKQGNMGKRNMSIHMLRMFIMTGLLKNSLPAICIV